MFIYNINLGHNSATIASTDLYIFGICTTEYPSSDSKITDLVSLFFFARLSMFVFCNRSKLNLLIAINRRHIPFT